MVVPCFGSSAAIECAPVCKPYYHEVSNRIDKIHTVVLNFVIPVQHVGVHGDCCQVESLVC